MQCGFCTPGMVLAVQALLDRVDEPDEEQIAEAIGGNICRCTGYVQIREAIASAVQTRCARGIDGRASTAAEREPA